KENSFDSYLIIPGSLQQSDSNECVSEAITGSSEVGASRHHLIQFNEFYFSHHFSKKEISYTRKFSASEDFVLMQFCLDGECHYWNDKYKKGVYFTSLEHNILFIPAKEEYMFSTKSKTLEIVNICVDKHLLLKYIPGDHKL